MEAFRGKYGYAQKRYTAMAGSILVYRQRFFYTAYHCLVFLDYYLTMPPVNYVSPLSYTLTAPGDIPKDAIDDVVPDSNYSKKELLDYLQSTREKCRTVINGLTEERLIARWSEGAETKDLALSGADAMQYSVLDMLLYNMKHVQHHVAQLNLLLRQTIHDAPDYISMAKDDI